MKLVIAEKPLTAEPIAANRKATTKRDGFFEGNGYVVTSAFGHLVELFEPEDYDERYKTWSLADLPILPKFQYKIQNDPYRKKRFYLIKSLLQNADEVINACDSDREGESIFWQILKQAGFTNFQRCKRLWVSDFNDSPLTTAFNNLKPLTQYQNEYLSAEARQKADWLYGMNLSRLLTKSAISGQWIFGRVQTPTLMIVCDAYFKHHNFVETPYWKVRVDLQKAPHTFFALNDKALPTRDAAEQLARLIPDQLTCTKSEVSDKIESAPLLFSLSALQQEAGKVFNLKMDQTLAAAQSLYEQHKLTTYPRTDSRHLPESLRTQVMDSLNIISADQRFPDDFRRCAHKLSQSKLTGGFDDRKVSSHHAIIPTQERSTGKALTAVEEKVYLLIVKQFVQAFMPPCEKKITRLEFAHAEDIFKASGAVLINEGWKAIDRTIGEKPHAQTPDEEDIDQRLPQMKVGEILKVTSRKVLEKKTKKPPLLTTSALSRLMATAGKFIDNEELSQAIKDCGIGTEATRADIVKRLYELDYITDQGKFIIPTPNGLKLHSILKDSRIASPELTGLFESKLHQISRNQLTQETFLKESTTVMLDHMRTLSEKARTLETQKPEKPSLYIICPQCKKGEILVGTNTYHCSLAKWSKTANAWHNSGCTFQIFKTLAGKKLTPTIIKQLLTTGTTKPIPGFLSKSKKKFSARLKLTSQFKIEFFVLL